MTNERARELFAHKDGALMICVGSWKAYNECNDHSLGSYFEGSYYINFNELEDGDELRDLLAFIGWSDEEMEETFIQDLDGVDPFCSGYDYISAFAIIEALVECCPNGRPEGEEWEKLEPIKEYTGESNFNDLLWMLDDYDYYPNTTGEEYEEQLIEDCYGDISEMMDSWLSGYISIDYEAIARDDDSIYEYNGGVLVVR